MSVRPRPIYPTPTSTPSTTVSRWARLCAPGAYLVLIRDFHAYREMHPTAPFHGFYEGKLSNRGETVRLLDAEGKVITAVTYDTANGWPLSADGKGDSLVLIDLNGDPNDPASWRASSTLYGSPGSDE